MSTYYVSTAGADAAGRDGLSWQTAWNSLAYASDRTPPGNYIIQLAAGSLSLLQQKQRSLKAALLSLAWDIAAQSMSRL